ncbi:MAG: TylF/MycF/NovP-related O-methyltransferase [Tagaea sp.]
MSDPNTDLAERVALVSARRQVEIDRDLAHQMYALAVRQSAEYAIKRLPTAHAIRPSRYPGQGRLELIEAALNMVRVENGLYAEFGVFKGETLSFIADRIDTVVYGFDSFRGLSSDWFIDVHRGQFDLGGVPPKISAVQENVRLINGYFQDTIPEFKRAVAGPMAFMHVDCDLYESTKSVFDGLEDRIVPGTVVLFDEYFNYPGWQNHEFKAFQEFCARTGRRYAYQAFCPQWFSVAVTMG